MTLAKIKIQIKKMVKIKMPKLMIKTNIKLSKIRYLVKIKSKMKKISADWDLEQK